MWGNTNVLLTSIQSLYILFRVLICGPVRQAASLDVGVHRRASGKKLHPTGSEIIPSTMPSLGSHCLNTSFDITGKSEEGIWCELFTGKFQSLTSRLNGWRCVVHHVDAPARMPSKSSGNICISFNPCLPPVEHPG
jgi:hypothetical protein